MKTIIKNYFMAIVAVMMVIGFSAFKATERTTVEFGVWHTTDTNNNPITVLVNLSGMDPDEYECIPDPGTCIILFDEDDVDENGDPKPEADPSGEILGRFEFN